MTSGLPVYNVVSDFGADPTASTISSAAFQAAINAAQSNPTAKIYVPGGSYIADGLQQTSQFGGIEGAGMGATVIRTSTSNATFLTVSDTFLASVSGMSLAGIGGAIQTGGSLISAIGSHRGFYRDIELSDAYQGISLVNSDNCEVTGCKAYSFYGPSIVYSGNGGGGTIKDNQFDTSSYGPSQWSSAGPASLMPSIWSAGQSTPQGKVMIANNCYFIAGSAGTTITAPVKTAFGTPCMDGSIAWYFLCESDFHQVWCASGSVENWISGNDMDGPSAGPIRLDDWGNSVIDNKLTNGLRSGIDLYGGSHHNIISMNLIDGFPLCGVQENSLSCIGNIITPNQILNCRSGAVVIKGTGGIYSPNVEV